MKLQRACRLVRPAFTPVADNARMSMTRSSREPRVALSHPVFRNLQPLVFRRAEDGTAVMIVNLGAEQAALPVGALCREFAIEPESEDGRMLALIEQALGYVAGLVPGDALPPEVLGGMSDPFRPTPEQLRRAAARLGAAPDELDAGDPAPRVPAAVVEILAVVESLRDTLIARITDFHRHAEALARAHRGESQRALTLGQVARLARVADTTLGERFGALDTTAGRAAVAPQAAMPALEAGCDVLHRNRIAWTPTLDAWERLPGSAVLGDWTLLESTYRFLAPRYMSTREWQARFLETCATPERAAAQMIW